MQTDQREKSRARRTWFEVVVINVCRKRRLNQALSVLYVSLGYCSVFCAVRYRGHFLCRVIFCLFVLYVLVDAIRLSVPVQVIDRKDSSAK